MLGWSLLSSSKCAVAEQNSILLLTLTSTPIFLAAASNAGLHHVSPKARPRAWEIGFGGFGAIAPSPVAVLLIRFLPMSQVAFAVVPLSNGTGSESLNGSSKEAFYERLLRLHDEVFAGKHPSLKVLGPVVQDVAKVASTRTTVPQSLHSFSTHQTRDDSAQSLTRALTSINLQPASAPLDGISVPSSVASAPLEVLQAPPKTSAPSIDPILLQKSDVLKEAERRLERKRLEQSLNIGRDHPKDATALTLPYLDVSDILGKAQQIEPHVSAFQPFQQMSHETSDSFDENSLYSSQNWSPQGPSGEPGPKDLNDGSDVMDISDEGEILESLNPGPALVNDATSSEHTSSRNERLLHPAGDYEPYVSALQPHPLHETEALQYADDEDDDDYSPPPPDSFAGSAAHHKSSGNQFKAPNLPQPSKGTYPKRGTASQPSHSRITGQHNAGPSTRRRDDQGGANQRDRRAGKYSRRQSPDNSRNVLQNPKKRRRGPDADEHGLRSVGKRRAAASPIARSPEPYIKSEPVSPPPFGLDSSIPTIPTKRPSRAVRALPEDIEIISPRIIRRRSDYQSEYDSTYDDYVSSANGYDTTVFRSPVASRRLQRDNEDLRRVASLQYARRPRSPALDVETYSSAGRLIAPASRSFSDHRPPPQIYQETVARPERVVRIVRSPPPPAHVTDQPIFARLAEPAVMAPPARRPVVVDQYGNEYFDVQTQTAVRHSVVPPTRRVEVEPFYQRTATREPTFRQSLREAYAYDDANDYQRMPPPQPRRTTKVTQSEFITEPRQRAYSLVPLQTTSPRNLEVLDAPSQQYDPARPATSMRDLRYTQQPTSEYVSRTYSARPEPAARQEAPVYQNTPANSQPLATPLPQPDYVPRAYSVHPDSAPSQRVRGGPAYHERVPSVYQNNGVSAGQSPQATYPPRAYSVAPNLASRYQENTEDMRNQFGAPNVPAFTPNYGSTPSAPTPQHGRPYVAEPGAAGANSFGGRGNDVYAYL